MKRYLNRPRICRSPQNALNLLHFPRRFDIIRKHGKLVWLSRQSDSLVMNRSAVRIRPPAPQKPARLSGFLCSPWAYSYRSLTLSVACSTPLADQMRRLRYSVALALLTNPPTSSTQPQGINSSTPQGFAGCLRFYPSRKSKIFAQGPRYLPHAHCQGSFPAGTRALLVGIFGRVRCGDEKARGVPRAFALPDRASPRRNLKEHIGFVAAAATTAVFVVLYRQSVSAV